MIQNIGGVSWWRLDGDASDELGNNPGTIVGSLSFVQGRAGQAASFDGTTSNIFVQVQLTICLWEILQEL